MNSSKRIETALMETLSLTGKLPEDIRKETKE